MVRFFRFDRNVCVCLCYGVHFVKDYQQAHMSLPKT